MYKFNFRIFLMSHCTWAPVAIKIALLSLFVQIINLRSHFAYACIGHNGYIFVMYTFSTTTIDIKRAKLSNYTCKTYVRDSNSLVILKFSIDAPHVCWVCFLWCVHFQLLYVVISPHGVSIAKFASCSAEDISLSLSKIFTDSLYASAVVLKKN